MKELIIELFGEKLICVFGVGKMFYQDGFPVSMAVAELSKSGIEVSLLHVADECLKNGWSAETTIRKLKDDFQDAGQSFDEESLILFCNSTYED